MVNKIASYISLVLSLIAISVCFLVIEIGDTTTITYNSLISAIGLIITSLAFTVGCYFAFIAVKAHQQLKEIEQSAKEIKILKGEVRDIENKHALFFIQSIEFHIYTENMFFRIKGVSHNKLKERRNELYRLKCRLAYQYPFLDKNIRVKLLSELAEFGNHEDLNPLEKVIKHEDDVEIIGIARKSKQEISDKLK